MQRFAGRKPKIAVLTILLFAFAAIVVAAGAPGRSADDPVDRRSQGLRSDGTPIVTLNDRLATVAAREPSFGGMYRDSTNGDVLVLLLTESSRSGAVETVLKEVLGDSVVPTGGVRVERADYSIRDLAVWYDLLRAEIGKLDGLVLTDLAEHINRLRIGAEDAEAAARFANIASGLGIPESAIEIELAPPAIPAHEIDTDEIEPREGGVQIENDDSGDVCTLGFVGKRYSVEGFVTNSHCTQNIGADDNDSVHQPTTADDHIGTEERDPATFTGGACVYTECRYSDSAFFKWESGISKSLGYIARVGTGGDLTRVGTWEITSEKGGDPTVGETLHKVGRTTGWTSGEVKGTCVDYGMSGTSITLLCQSEVDLDSSGGDSGAPVFSRDSGSNFEVELYGIFWGISTWDVYSPLDLVYTDMGGGSTNWTVCSSSC